MSTKARTHVALGSFYTYFNRKGDSEASLHVVGGLHHIYMLIDAH